MPNFVKRLTSKVGKILNKARKRIRKPKITVGYRGTPKGGFKRGERKLTPKELLAKRTVPKDEVEGFVYQQDWMPVNSSNVESAQYFADDEQMLVKYLGDGSYLYSNISPQEALTFAQASSKGGWVWDHLRVRGSKTAHRKPYRKVAG